MEKFEIGRKNYFTNMSELLSFFTPEKSPQISFSNTKISV